MTTNDGFVEGNNGQAFASMSDISVTDLAGLNLVIASATARGPTTQSGTTPVNAVRELTVNGTPAQNHHEVRLRWTTRCQSIVAGLIGNGVMCEAGFGYRVDLVGGVIRLAPRGGGFLSIAAGLVGTPTPTAAPTPTATPVLPVVSVRDASVVEGDRGTASMLFTIDADRLHIVPITVRLATVNGSATDGADYTARNITVTLPAGVNQVTASIPVLGDARQQGNETFTFNIGNPTNAAIGLGQATGTIVDDDSPVGIAELVAGNGVVAAGETVPLTLRWDHPARWRDLDSVDLRLIDDTGAAFWGRFTEGEDHFSLCEAASCSGSFAPGVGDPVDTGASTFHPASSVVRGSGASGPSVDLTSAVSLADSTRGRRFRIEAAASGDNGDEQPFATVGTLSVDSGSAGADGDGCQVGNRGGGATGFCMLLIAGLVLVARAGSRARRRITDCAAAQAAPSPGCSTIRSPVAQCCFGNDHVACASDRHRRTRPAAEKESLMRTRILLFAALAATAMSFRPAAGDTLFSPPLVAAGSNVFDCYLVNVSLKPRKVKIEVINRAGDVVETVETTLGPGQEDVARASADLLARYCKFVVQGSRQLFRASVLVRQDGVGAISALAAQ